MLYCVSLTTGINTLWKMICKKVLIEDILEVFSIAGKRSSSVITGYIIGSLTTILPLKITLLTVSLAP